MARISKGKFRNLRDHFQSQKYFTVTKKNINSLKIMLGEDIQVGEQYIMRPMPMSDELVKAMNSAGGKMFDNAVAKRLRNSSPALKSLLERQTRWAE